MSLFDQAIFGYAFTVIVVLTFERISRNIEKLLYILIVNFNNDNWIRMLLRLLQLAMIAVPVGSYICGSQGQCNCVQDFWVVCDEVKEVPFFRMNIRCQRGMMLTIDAAPGNFDDGTLRLTRGFHLTILRVACCGRDTALRSCSSSRGSHVSA